MLPLVDRELTRAARRKTPYALRVLIPAFSLVLLGILWYWLDLWSDVAEEGGPDFGSEWLGRVLTTATFAFQVATVVIMAPLLSAGTITQEKQDRTLGLLLLADMRGLDIIFCKWLSSFLQVELLLLTTLPVLAIAALFGGVAVPVMALQVLLLTSAAGTVCALGLLMSTLARRTGEAIVATLILIVAYSFLVGAAGRVVWPGLQLDIFTAAYQAESLYLLGTWYWIRPLIVAVVATASLLSFAAYRLPAQAFDRAVARKTRHGMMGGLTAPIRLPRRRRKQEDPVSAFVRRCSIGFASSVRSDLLKAFLAFGLGFVSVMICAVGMPLIVALLAYDITSSARHMKRSGMLDDLRLTTLDGREWARGIYRGHLRRCWVYSPAVLINSAYGLGMMSMMVAPVIDEFDPIASQIGQYAFYAVIIVALVAYAILLLRMLVATSCFFSRTRFAVGVQTFLVVLVYVIFRTILTVATFLMSAASAGMRTGVVIPAGDWFLLPIYAGINIGGVALLLLFFYLVHRESYLDERWFDE